MRLSHSPTGEIVAKKYFKALEKGRRLSWTEVTAEPTFLILDSVSVFNGHTPVRQSCYTRSSLNSSELCQITHKAWKSRRRAPNHVTELRDYRKFQVSVPNLHFEHWRYRIHNRTAWFRNQCKTCADILCGRPPRAAQLDLWPFKRKIVAPVIPALGNLHTQFWFFYAFLFSIVLDKRTGKSRNEAY